MVNSFSVTMLLLLILFSLLSSSSLSRLFLMVVSARPWPRLPPGSRLLLLFPNSLPFSVTLELALSQSSPTLSLRRRRRRKPPRLPLSPRKRRKRRRRMSTLLTLYHQPNSIFSTSKLTSSTSLTSLVKVSMRPSSKSISMDSLSGSCSMRSTVAKVRFFSRLITCSTDLCRELITSRNTLSLVTPLLVMRVTTILRVSGFSEVTSFPRRCSTILSSSTTNTERWMLSTTPKTRNSLETSGVVPSVKRPTVRKSVPLPGTNEMHYSIYCTKKSLY
mmetsp:Transcript_42410/g.30596  ORF Transcript_42410/g.30596 Transcript_42410/m.30596 type:complete len:275 (+) Transcript_42410:470-1294(+)